MYSILKSIMSEKRLKHSLNVAKTAKELAKIYGANPRKAEMAGLLHDITKEFFFNEQLKIIQNHNYKMDKFAMQSRALWHSISGSIYVQNKFGIRDIDIINSIRYHTTGRSGMSMLEKIIYVADFISDERDFEGVEKIREQANKNLNLAVFEGLLYSIEKLLSFKIPVPTDTFSAYNDILFSLGGFKNGC